MVDAPGEPDPKNLLRLSRQLCAFSNAAQKAAENNAVGAHPPALLAGLLHGCRSCTGSRLAAGKACCTLDGAGGRGSPSSDPHPALQVMVDLAMKCFIARSGGVLPCSGQHPPQAWTRSPCWYI